MAKLIRKRATRAIRKEFGGLIEKMKASGIEVDDIRRPPQGLLKISDALHALVHPYFGAATTLDEIQKLFMLATVAWNVAIVDAEKGDELMSSLRSTMDEDAWDDFTELVAAFVARKRLLFPNDNRFVVSVEVTDTGDSYHIAAASTPPRDTTGDESTP